MFSPQSAPATSALLQISNVLCEGTFAPALIQRQFEWSDADAVKLLDTLEKTFSLRDDQSTGAKVDVTAGDNSSADDGDERDDGETADDIDGGEEPGPAVDVSDMEDLADIPEGEEPSSRTSEFYLGGFILRRRKSHFEIFDGLQRITTLTILLSVLRDQLDDGPVKAAVSGCIIHNSGVRLSLFGRDETLKKHVQLSGATTKKRDGRAYYALGRNILRVKNSLLEKVEAWDRDKTERFARFLLERVWVCVVLVDDVALAQEMFINTNLFGKRLDAIDVLKGQLMDVAAKGLSEADVLAFERQWTETRNLSGDTFTDMLKAFDVIERQKPQVEEAWATDLGLYVDTKYGAANIARFQNRLWSHNKGWVELKRLMRNGGETRLEQDVFRLGLFWWPEWHPLALKWWQDVRLAHRQGTWSKRKRSLKSKFDRLHRRCMAISLAKFSANDRQKIFRNAIAEDREGRDVFQGALAMKPNQKRKIDHTLSGPIWQQDVWAPLVRWLEALEWRDDLPKLVQSGSVEHVLPRSVNWDEDSQIAAQHYNSACYSIGNLVLVPNKLNTQLSNKPVAEKLQLLHGKVSGYRLLDEILVDGGGRPRGDWTAGDIHARADVLRGRVWEALRIKPPNEA